MRIVYVSAARPESQTAHAIYVREMAAAFSHLGVDFVVVAPGHWNRARERFGYETYGAPASGFELTLVGCYPPAAFRYYAMALRLMLAFPESNADMIMTHNGLLALVVASTGRDYALDLHKETRTRVGRLVLQRLTRHARCRAVFGISEGHRETLVKAGIPTSKICIARNGVDQPAAHLSKDQARRILGLGCERAVVYAGSLSPDRGLELLIDAAGMIAECPRFVILGGERRQIDGYRELISRRGLGKAFTFTGRVPHEQVATYLAAGDVLIALYTSQVPTIGVMSPMKLFEYMAAGRPIVAPAFARVAEVLTHDETAYLFEPGCARDLATGISKCLTDAGYADRLSKTALEQAKQATWAARAQRMCDFISTR